MPSQTYECVVCKDTGIVTTGHGQKGCVCGTTPTPFEYKVLALVPHGALARIRNGVPPDNCGGVEFTKLELPSWEAFLIKPFLERPVPNQTFRINPDERKKIADFIRQTPELTFKNAVDGLEHKVTDFWRTRLLTMFSLGEDVWMVKK